MPIPYDSPTTTDWFPIARRIEAALHPEATPGELAIAQLWRSLLVHTFQSRIDERERRAAEGQ